MVGGRGGKPLVENMKSRLLTRVQTLVTKKVDFQFHFSKGRWWGQVPCFATVIPRFNELIRRMRSFHSSKTVSEFSQAAKMLTMAPWWELHWKSNKMPIQINDIHACGSGSRERSSGDSNESLGLINTNNLRA